MLRYVPESSLSVVEMLLVLALWYAWTWWFLYPPAVFPPCPGQPSPADNSCSGNIQPCKGWQDLPSSLISLIWLDTNCNRPWFGELPFAKLNPWRSHTQTLIYEHQTLSVLCDFLYWNHARPALKQKRAGDQILVSDEFREFRDHRRLCDSNAE